MNRRRVVVTGLGMVSPVGNTVGESWANLVAGRSGIARITKFDPSAFACHIAGEVKDPKRNIPLSLVLGAGIVIFLYFLANLSYVLILPVHGSPES